MNWKSTAISEVAKEKIWKEHVQTEAQHRIVFDTFRVNAARMAHARPVTEGINKRPKRFLDREAALLESMAKRGLIDLADHSLDGPSSNTQSAVTISTAPAVRLPDLAASPQKQKAPTAENPATSGTPSLSPARVGDGEAESLKVPTPPSRGASFSPRHLSVDAKKSSPSSPVAALSPRKLAPAADDFEALFEQVHWSPVQKYREPQTSTQTIGWRTEPLVPINKKFCFGHRSCEITRFAQELQLANKRSGGAPAAASHAGSPKR